MRTKFTVLALCFAGWLPAASVLVWVWPALVVVALVVGWWLARWSSGMRHPYISGMGPSFLTMAVVFTLSLRSPDATFGLLLGQVGVLQFLCALASFAFVRHVLQPAGQ